jgi:hypothetical protein
MNMQQGQAGEIVEAASKAQRPAARKRSRNCRECGSTFQTFRVEAAFCGDACRLAAKNRDLKRGARLLRLAMEHRRNRGRGLVQYGDITALLDQFVAEDRARERRLGVTIEEPAKEIRKVEVNGRIVGQIERIGGEWYWRAKASGALRDTTLRHREIAEHAIPLRYRREKTCRMLAG